MASLTKTQARNEVVTLVKTAWDAGAGTPIPLMIYPDLDRKHPDTGAWGRMNMQHAPVAGEATLAGGLGTQTFTRLGVVIVQIFDDAGKGYSRLDVLTKVMEDAFEGKSTPGGVWFRNVRAPEVGVDGRFQQVNVLADFNYVEIK